LFAVEAHIHLDELSSLVGESDEDRFPVVDRCRLFLDEALIDEVICELAVCRPRQARLFDHAIVDVTEASPLVAVRRHYCESNRGGAPPPKSLKEGLNIL